MVTEEQYNEAKKLIKQYESEQLDLLRVMSSNFVGGIWTKI